MCRTAMPYQNDALWIIRPLSLRSVPFEDELEKLEDIRRMIRMEEYRTVGGHFG